MKAAVKKETTKSVKVVTSKQKSNAKLPAIESIPKAEKEKISKEEREYNVNPTATVYTSLRLEFLMPEAEVLFYIYPDELKTK